MTRIARGEIWWADLGEPHGSEPGFSRPVLVVQTNAFNRSRIGTIVVVALTSNLRLANAPGNTLLRSEDSGLPKDSVVNVSQLLAVDRADLTELVGTIPPDIQRSVDEGLRLILAL